MSWKLIFAAALFVLAGSIAASAQIAPATSRPASASGIDREFFEVTSIRSLDPRNLPGGLEAIVPCSGLLEPTAGRLTITAATVYRLVAAAYGMSCGATNNLDLISGSPDWLKKEAFNIQATLPQGTPLYTIRQLQDGEAPKLQAMLRNLLADRFQLVLHRAPKDTPIFNVYFVKEGKVKLSADQAKPGESPNPLASPLQVGNDPVAGIVRVRGDAIPILARILSVADVFDACSSERPYRPALSLNESMNILRQNAAEGGLDPDLVSKFCEAQSKFEFPAKAVATSQP